MRTPFGDYLDRLRGCGDACTVAAELFHRTAAMGFDCGIMVELAPGAAGPDLRSLHVQPMSDELDDYVVRGLHRHDPLFVRLMAAVAPYEMGPEELSLGEATPERRRLLGYAMIATKRRVTLPPVGGDASVWALSFGVDAGARTDADGGLWLAASAAAARIVEIAREGARPPSTLTPRERECLLLLASGLRVDRIAERLGLSNATVEMHLAGARRRVGARTSPEAVAKAIVRGWIAP